MAAETPPENTSPRQAQIIHEESLLKRIKHLGTLQMFEVRSLILLACLAYQINVCSMS